MLQCKSMPAVCPYTYMTCVLVHSYLCRRVYLAELLPDGGQLLLIAGSHCPPNLALHEYARPSDGCESTSRVSAERESGTSNPHPIVFDQVLAYQLADKACMYAQKL